MFTYIDTGNDSDVYTYKKDQTILIAKNYSRLIKNTQRIFGANVDPVKILTQYHIDTLKTKELFEKDFSPFILSINQGDYTVSVHIVPQGELKHNSHTLFSFGQQYIQGMNVDNMIYDYAFTGVKDQLYETRKLVTSHANTDELFIELFNRIEHANTILGRSFDFHKKNVIPHLDQEQKKLDLHITDLAGSLIGSYCGFESYKKNEFSSD